MRAEPEHRKERAALWSIAASAGITLAKGAAGIATGSLALISDAAHSLLDVASTTMTWLAVRAAHKPADAQHQHGHGKVESLAALAQTAFVLSGAVAYEGCAGSPRVDRRSSRAGRRRACSSSRSPSTPGAGAA